MVRNKAQLEKDMIRLAELYLKGWSQRRIAADIGVSQAQINKDLKKLRAEWLQSALVDFDAAKARELAKIDALEARAWEAFEASAGKKVRTTKEKSTGGKDGGRSRVVVNEEESAGDPRFLDRVSWCIEKRCRIFGIDAPTKISPTTPDGKEALPGNVVFYIPDNGRDPELNNPQGVDDGRDQS